MLVSTSTVKKSYKEKSWFVDTRIQLWVTKTISSIMKKQRAILLQYGKKEMDFLITIL